MSEPETHQIPTEIQVQTKSIADARNLRISGVTINGIPTSAIRASLGRLIHEGSKSNGLKSERLILDLDKFALAVALPDEASSKEKLEVVFVVEQVPGE